MNEFCCGIAEEFYDDLCDTYGGNYTYRYFTMCPVHQRVWTRYQGARNFNADNSEFEELFDATEISYILNRFKNK